MGVEIVISTICSGMLLLTGCGSKQVRMQALVPAPVPVLTAKRNVAVTDFSDDKVNLGAKIESNLASITLDQKNFFTVANRAQINKILAEQKLQSSDLSNGTKAAKVGKLIGAQAIIGGSVSSSFEDGSYIEQREKCVATNDAGKCVQTKTYAVTCPTSAANVSANINVIDVETGSTIHAKSITKNFTADGCKISVLGGFATTDGEILRGSQAVNGLADNIANEFVEKLAPRYVSYNVELMEKVA